MVRVGMEGGGPSNCGSAMLPIPASSLLVQFVSNSTKQKSDAPPRTIEIIEFLKLFLKNFIAVRKSKINLFFNNPHTGHNTDANMTR